MLLFWSMNVRVDLDTRVSVGNLQSLLVDALNEPHDKTICAHNMLVKFECRYFNISLINN